MFVSQAAEIINIELKKKPTVKLWCLLGDATQEVKHYETAWELSGKKSSRAQRHWGFYYYSKQNVSFTQFSILFQTINI